MYSWTPLPYVEVDPYIYLNLLTTTICCSACLFVHEHDIPIFLKGDEVKLSTWPCLCPVGRRLHIRPNAREEGRPWRKADAGTEIACPWHKQRVSSYGACVLTHVCVHTQSDPQLKSFLCTRLLHFLSLQGEGRTDPLIVRILFVTVFVPALQGFYSDNRIILSCSEEYIVEYHILSRRELHIPPPPPHTHFW
jgi:hypothetical protein